MTALAAGRTQKSENLTQPGLSKPSCGLLYPAGRHVNNCDADGSKAPRDVHKPSGQLSLRHKRDVTGVIKIMALNMGRPCWVIWRVQSNTEPLKNRGLLDKRNEGEEETCKIPRTPMPGSFFFFNLFGCTRC